MEKGSERKNGSAGKSIWLKYQQTGIMQEIYDLVEAILTEKQCLTTTVFGCFRMFSV